LEEPWAEFLIPAENEDALLADMENEEIPLLEDSDEELDIDSD